MQLVNCPYFKIEQDLICNFSLTIVFKCYCKIFEHLTLMCKLRHWHEMMLLFNATINFKKKKKFKYIYKHALIVFIYIT